MPALLEWPEVATELLSFVGTFATVGAIGFRYAVARGRLSPASPPASPLRAAGADDGAIYAPAVGRAAVIGLVGAVLRALLLDARLPELAARQHVSVAQLVTGAFQPGAQVVLIAAMLLGFALAVGHRGAGWPLAALGVLGTVALPAVTGEWARLVNPLHVLAGGLWIGTLFVLVVAGLPVALRRGGAPGRAHLIVAEMVNAFSPLALVAASFVAFFGVSTAWRHLPTLSALWTTPYGYVLVVKLATVAAVVALGAWNWRRVRPTLGPDAATAALRRSARMELVVAGVVLVLSAVLVSLPSPKRPAIAPGAPAAPSAQ